MTRANREARRWTVGHSDTVREPGENDWTVGYMLPAFRQALESNHGRVACWYPLDADAVVALMRSGQVFLVRGVWDEKMQRTQIAVEPARRPEAGPTS
ncbi:MAG: hypothetical protein ACRENJ_03865 [Candidatus Eiseniibacteriota bacterium]